MSTVAIILAADERDEFPGPKYLTPLRGQPLLQHVVDDAVGWPVDEVIVVLGPDADQVMEAVDFKDHTVVMDPEWMEGSAAPLRAALDLASRDRSVKRCVIARGDQPGVDASTVGALLDAMVDSAQAALPKYRYTVGWPVVLDVSIWEHLLGGEGSIDVLDFVASHAQDAAEVWFDHLQLTAYETPDDLPQARR